MKQIYVDTNVFLSYWFSDFGRIEDFQEYRTKSLFDRAIKCEFKMLISGLTLYEMSAVSGLSKKELIKDWVKPFIAAKKLQILEANQDDITRALNLVKKRKVKHKADAIHAVLAMKNNLTL